jgi:hypothetical protein
MKKKKKYSILKNREYKCNIVLGMHYPCENGDSIWYNEDPRFHGVKSLKVQYLT